MIKALIVTIAYQPPRSLLTNLAVDYFPQMVLDNSPSETSWLKDYCQQYDRQYCWLGGNRGIAAALNRGAELAREQGYDYLVTLDQDSQLTSEILQRMSEFIRAYPQPERVAIFSPRHVNPQAPSVSYSVEYQDDVWTMTSANFLNLAAWMQVGGFDERLFIDLVDFDFNVRARLCGYLILVVNRITINQFVGKNATTKWIGKYAFDVWHHDKQRKYYQARNYHYIADKYADSVPEVAHLKRIIRKMPLGIILFEEDKLAKLYHYYRGLWDYWRIKLSTTNSKVES